MKKVFEKIIEKLEEQKVKGIYDSSSIIGEKNVWGKAIEIVKQEAEKYEECYKDCGDCEAYNKEKHHCPKFCKVIKETVKEIEENHNGWIPISDRLPDDFMSFEYLTIRKGHTLATITYYCVVNHKWYLSRNSSKEIDVIAWQPLPQPYQPKGE